MTLTLKRNHIVSTIGLLCLTLFFLWGTSVHAQVEQGSVSITVAPTLMELGLAPGEVWRSSVKVINTNSFPLRIQATPAHFRAVGERGVSQTVPVSDIPTDETVLARWITVEADVVTIEPGESVQIPFRITAPEDATPGSHFAAIQLSTVPPQGLVTTGLSTAQVISSLLFVRVAGDITEAANLRGFTADHSFDVEPATTFTARVENLGNVHLQPVGEIVIRNMWGSERGKIPFNYNTSFGNVLPESVREYTFSWRKAPSLLDVGYYTATLSLAYGSESRQFLRAETGFWVIPVKPILVAFGVLGLLVMSIFLISRWYIRWLLRQAGVTSLASLQSGAVPATRAVRKVSNDVDLDLTHNPTEATRSSFAPVIAALYRCMQTARSTYQQGKLVWTYVPTKQRVLIVGGLTVLIIGMSWAVRSDTRSTDYEAQVGTGAEAVTYNAEEITFFQQPGMSPAVLAPDSTYEIILINEGRRTGAAGELAAVLVPQYPVTVLQPGATDKRDRTAVVFPPALQAEALALNEALGGALLSAFPDATSTVITVYVGNDYPW